MVRLKVGLRLVMLASKSYFNSTMVRLKVIYLAGRKDKRKFQFHYGTIKSERRRKHVIRREYFNSTMVRLKACKDK